MIEHPPTSPVAVQPSRLDRRGFLRLGLAAVGVPTLGGVLAACGGSQGGSLGAGQPTRSGSASTQRVGQLVIATAATPWLDGYKAMLAEYQQKTGIRMIAREFPFDGLRTQMINALQSGSAVFDVLQINEQWVGEFYDHGWVKPLREIDPRFAPDPQLISYQGVGSWDPTSKVTDPEGTPYALPINGNAHIYVYRKDLFDELGRSVPTTFEQAIAAGRAARSAKKAAYGYVTRGTNTVSFDLSPVLNGNGGDWFVEPGRDWTPRINDDIGVASMETFLELLSLGPASPQTVDQAQVGAAVQSGQALQGHMVAALGSQFEDPASSRVAGKLGYAAVPAGTRRSAPASGTWVLGVPAKAEDARAKAAYDFISWLVGKQAMTTWATEHGGIVTREDALRAAAGSDAGYLKVLADERDTVTAGFRYTFAAEMVNAIEPPLSRIVTGDAPVKRGLDEVARAMEQVVADAGLAG
jgi:multiple sugar transport system substrate-binding protein